MKRFPLAYSQEVIDDLAKEYNFSVIDQFTLLYYDTNWNGLINLLLKTKKEVYAPDEKYVVHHADTEYFFKNTGLTIDNFNTIIKYLDIDPCRFVILTNLYQSRRRWLEYSPDPNNQFLVIETPFSNLAKATSEELSQEFTNACTQHFICMMGLKRSHRDVLFNFLCKQELDKNNLISYRQSTYVQPIDISVSNFSFDIPLIKIDPFTRINERWDIDDNLRSFLTPNEPVPLSLDFPDGKYLCPWYQQIFVDLVSETVFNYPSGFISEKTLRPIVCFRPFIISGAPLTLQWLRNFGFKTFSQWWDESYDSEADCNARMIKIFNIVLEISKWTMSDCRQVLSEMQDTLMHNRQRFVELAR